MHVIICVIIIEKSQFAGPYKLYMSHALCVVSFFTHLEAIKQIYFKKKLSSFFAS